MPADPIDQIRAGFDQMLAGAAAYYDGLRDMLARPDLDAAGRAQVLDALGRATELVEVLESVTINRVRWLAAAGVPA